MLNPISTSTSLTSFKTLIANNEKTVCYPFSGIWFDLGRAQDFAAVNDELDTLEQRIPSMRQSC